MAAHDDPVANAADVLQDIVQRRSKEQWENSRVLRGLLADRHVSDADATLIVNALTEGLPARIARERPDTPREVLLGVLTRRLVEGQGLSRERAVWAASSWLHALAPSDSPAAAVTAPASDARAPHRGESDGTGTRLIPAPLHQAPPTARPWTRYLAVAGAALVLAYGVDRWRSSGIASLEIRPVALDVFVSDVTTDDPYAPVTFISACPARGTPPATSCRRSASARPTTAFVGVDQTVTYLAPPDSRRRVVPGSCVLTGAGQQDASQPTQATLSGSMAGEARRTAARWRAVFARPAGGWTPGRHAVSCQSALVRWSGWFEVAP